MTDTTVHWRPADAPPEPLVDVLLHQVMGDMDDDDSKLIRIGYRNQQGQWVDSYSTDLDDADDVLEHITYWAPLPENPKPDIAPCPTPWPGDDCTVSQCVSRKHCWCGAEK